jgi:hypothetical protein
VYQDFGLVGWLVGPDSEKFACYLVENFDFGAAVFDVNLCLDIEEDSISFGTLLPNASNISEKSDLTAEINSPAFLDWRDIKDSIELRRAITWEGAGELNGRITQEHFITKYSLREENYVEFRDSGITLVPNIWHPQTKQVFIYVGRDLAGELTDPLESSAYFDALTQSGYKVGHAKKAVAYVEGEDCFLAIDGELRDILRVDWDQVEKEIK